MKNLLVICALAAAAAGCAAPDAQTSQEPVAQREYPTGSNIPRRSRPDQTDGVTTHDRAEVERARGQAPVRPRPGLGGSP